MEKALTDTLVVTGCDDKHFAFATDLIDSLNAVRDGSFKLGFVNIDDGEQCRALERSVDLYLAIGSGADEGLRGFKVAYMSLKGRLPELFPGFSHYVWMDGDTWVQNTQGIARAVRGADRADVAVHPQLDPHYYSVRIPGEYTVDCYRILLPDAGSDIWRYPMINTGVFGARADSRLWSEWTDILHAIAGRSGGEKGFFGDQIPLHYLVATGKISIHPLRAVDNWMVMEATPSLNASTKKVVVPTEPYEEINTLHLAGWAKTRTYNLGPSGSPITFTYRDIKRYFSGGG
jgi:hypothetical protein